MRIRKQREEKWFDFEDDPDGGRVKIRELKPSEEQDLWTEAFAYVLDKFPDADQTSSSFMALINRKNIEMALVSAVTAWENFFNGDGEPIDCNEENVLLAMQEIDGCYNAFVIFRNELTKINRKETEAQEKNS